MLQNFYAPLPAFLRRNRPALVAIGVFLFLLIKPAYIAYLRHHVAVKYPEIWRDLPTNGRFRLLLPGLTSTLFGDQSQYSARVHQILLHGFPVNPYWREERGLHSWFHQFIPMYALAGVVWICGGDMNLGWIVAVAILGALWFLLFYHAFRWWSVRDDVAIPLALFSILFPDIYFFLLDINFSPAITWERYAVTFFQHFSIVRPYSYRMPSNFLTQLPLCFLFVRTWKMMNAPGRGLREAVWVGLGYGALAAVHVYVFIVGMATLSVMAVCSWILDQSRASRWRPALALAIALGLSAAYFALLLHVSAPHTSSIDSMELQRLEHSRRFYLITLIYPLFACFGFYQGKREQGARRNAWHFLAMTQIAVFLCRNAQVILGVTIQPFHFIPMGSLTGCFMVFLWLSGVLARVSWWNRHVALAVSLGIVLWALSNEKAGAEQTYRMFGLPLDTDAGLQWVESNVPKDGLVLSLSAEVNHLIPIYTSAKTQFAPWSPNLSSPFTTDHWIYKIAQLLKTCHADVDRFLADRMPKGEAADRMFARGNAEMQLMGKVDRVFSECSLWDVRFLRDCPRRIAAMSETAKPIDPPFYLWVDSTDNRYLEETPESFGGRVAFANALVRIYKFAGPESAD